jgi:hypothetical protein
MGIGPEPGRDVIGYEVHVGPGPNDKILIHAFGLIRRSWRVMQIKDGRYNGWNGDFTSAEEALTSVADLC